jgi:protein O-GlcNAc transferase
MNNNQLYIAPIKYKRKDFNLPDKGTVYACFNGNFKIDPIMFEVWMNILKKVSGSVLWLTESSPLSTNNLRKEAEKMGVDPNRIVLSPRMNEPESMARHKLVDIYLNTRLFNGCTTVSDALFMNIPVITLLGNHFASRQASGLLTAIGMPELIAHDLGEYEKIAVEMGNHPTKYKKSKEKLKKNRKTYPLFNTKLFVKNLETAYKKIWKLYLDGKKPEDIHF